MSWFVFGSDLTKIREVVPAILIHTKLQFPQVSETDIKDLRLVYSELLVNAIVHGNKCDLSKKVVMRIEFEHDGIMSVIKDEGDGFDFQHKLEQEEEGITLDDHGRGLQIVSFLVDQLDFNSRGNEITFRKSLAQ